MPPAWPIAAAGEEPAPDSAGAGTAGTTTGRKVAPASNNAGYASSERSSRNQQPLQNRHNPLAGAAIPFFWNPALFPLAGH